jgi:hypothetical protein
LDRFGVVNAKESAMGRIAIACYQPKPGQEDALRALVAEHVPTLRAIGLATDRSPIAMQGKDGTIIEVFEWVSPEAIQAAHAHPVVLKMWEQYSQLSNYLPLAKVSEASDLFAEFAPVAVKT